VQDGYQLKLVAEHTWADCLRLGEAAFSPDGKTLYLMKQPDELNLGSGGVSFWPEALALAALVVVWIAVRRVVTAVRQRQDRLKVYCRGCGYDLGGTAEGGVCPECGKERRVRGRSVARRVVPPACAAMLLVGASVCAYVMGWRSQLPQCLVPTGPCSRVAYGWAERVSPAWAQDHCILGGDLVRIDAKGGGVGAEPVLSLSGCIGGVRLSHDGRTAAVLGAGRAGYTARVFDLSTGREIAQRAMKGEPQPGGTLIGFDAKGRLLVADNDREQGRASLVAWDPFSRAETALGEERVGTMQMGKLTLTLAPSYAVSGDGARLVSVSSSLGDTPVEVATWDTASGARTVVKGNWEGARAGAGTFAVDGKGPMVYLPVAGNPTFWDLPGGKRVTPGRMRTRYLNGPCALAEEAGVVATVGTFDSSLIVMRCGSAEQVAEIALPRKTIVMRVAISADGERVAVVGFDYTGGKTGMDVKYVHRVYLYELSGRGEER
jgi:hypothetical protein